MRSLVTLIALSAAGVLAAFPALAQAPYKSTMPDGQVIYGDKPVPGAAKVEQTRIPPSKGVTPPSAKETATLQKLESGRRQDEAARNRVIAAEKALAEAEAKAAAGKEPLPGERIGTAGGASRLTDAYFERQKALEQAVQQARAGLEQARGGK
jgi:hypothetical protein